MSTKEPAEVIVLPRGRLIHHHFFERDQFNEQSAPRYTAEVAYNRGELDDLFDKCLDFAVATWGEGADAEDAELILPIKNGDDMAAKRETEGKPGDVYVGKDVIRANTIFNKDGDRADGGILVYAPNGKDKIGIVNRDEVYNGCAVILGITLSSYTTQDGKNAITFYLSAVQKADEGERINTGSNHDQLFQDQKPVGRQNSESKVEAGGRRRRAG
jgi:hypothetical protein